MIARVMEGLVLCFVCFCVAGSLTVSTIQVEEDYDVQLVNTDALKPELENEINASLGSASLDNFGVEERFKRVAVPNQDTLVRQNDSRFKLAEVNGKSPVDGIYWKDNVETQRLGHGEATVTRVIHHGIYPSLTITEPISGRNRTSRVVKALAKRDLFGRSSGSSSVSVDYRYNSTSSNITHHHETAFQVKDEPRTVHNTNNSNRRYDSVHFQNNSPRVTNYRYDSSGSSNGTYHRETSFQSKDGPRTVHNTRNSEDQTTYTRYESHYPPNNNNRDRYDSRITKSRMKRDWLVGNSPLSSTKVDYSYDSTSSSSGTYHHETSLQVKKGPYTVHDTRNSQDETAYSRYEYHNPPNNANRRYDATNVKNTNPQKTNYRYDSRSSSSGAYQRGTSIQVKKGPHTVYDARNSQGASTYSGYDAHYPPNNQHYGAVNIHNTPLRNTQSRIKRGWFGGTTRSPYTKVDYKFDSSGSSNSTYHRETSFQVKDGPRTVHETRNNEDKTTHTRYEYHYPPINDKRRTDAINVKNTTPRTQWIRAKRSSGLGTSRSGGYMYDSADSLNKTFHHRTSIQVNNENGSAYNRWNNQNSTIKTTYQAHYPPHNASTLHEHPHHGFARNFSYVRALHPANGSRDYSFYTHQFQQPNSNKTNSTTYRTLYIPESNSVDTFRDFRKDENNKGNVRLISVGYYSVNESRNGVRSYYNPSVRVRSDYTESTRTNGFERARYRRDTKHLGWLDRLFVSIGLAKLKTEEHSIPAGSEVVKLEVSGGGNEVVQNHYGYSSNGHHHVETTQIDRIYLVGGASSTSAVPTPIVSSGKTAGDVETSDATSYEDISGSSEELQGHPDEFFWDQQPANDIPFSEDPRTKEVLIQAPPRPIKCKPPKRLARGRCRTVW